MTNSNRRDFLRWNLALAASLAPGLGIVNAMRPVHAASISGGYKALVCVYLAGGNDSFNMFVPYGGSAHSAYATARQDLAIPTADLIPVDPVSGGTIRHGFHENMPAMADLFDQGSLAVAANVGTLIRPITKSQYESNASSVPAHLFSHNDQSDRWMAADASNRYGQGWAGRMMDMLYDNAAVPRPSPSISIGGNNLWQSGRDVRLFEMSAGGVSSAHLPWHEGPFKLQDAYEQVSAAGKRNDSLFVAEHALRQERAIEFSRYVNAALEGAPDFEGVFGGDPLSAQLRMVARLIAVRDLLDPDRTVNRQVYFVQIGGWDTHAEQNGDTESNHPNLLGVLSGALGAFQSALDSVDMRDQVTTFTATEFGRSLTPNGSGTDHGWGGHSLVMGGAVSGNAVYGTLPELAIDSDDTVENNRIIPSTSVDQYGATLARWFGMNESELNNLFPNLGNFQDRDMGFMLS
ncbi:MAG: DUF1501 domain-containing protein [Granulosicoccus sp.]